MFPFLFIKALVSHLWYKIKKALVVLLLSVCTEQTVTHCVANVSRQNMKRDEGCVCVCV